MKHSRNLIAVEIPRDVAEHLLEQLVLAARVPVRLDWSDEDELRQAVKDAIAADDA